MKKTNAKIPLRKGKNEELLKTIGPIEDLESYVKADWWRQIFNANYLRTDGDVVEDQFITRSEIDLFSNILDLKEDSVILDLCCGQGRHLRELASRGYSRLHGLDRSHYLINRARGLNRKIGYKILLKEGDARKLPFPVDTFDYIIIAGNSFGYFETVEDDISVLNQVKRVLKPNGKVLIDITDGEYMKESFQPRSWEWIDKTYFVCRERSLSDDNRLVSREVITHTQKGVIADQFYAERLYSKESLCALLEKAEFGQIQSHQELVTESSRNQDLGMMAKRVIFTAVAEKQWSKISQPSTARKNVTVILGDHRKIDLVKPNHTFDSDDFHTIDELKKALAKIKNYHFSYLDQHSTLIRDLQKKNEKVDYVLNLCDEGYNNEATKELHVAALLEMLDIHYTGGTPQCLAYCYDKSLVRGVAKEMDIPVPHAFMISPEELNFISLQIEFPIIIKPNFGDSSFGITQENVCYNIEQLERAIMLVRSRSGYEKPLLAEQFLTGKDISVGIIGNPPENYLALPIIEEDYSGLPDGLPKICGYEAKWDPTSPYWDLTSKTADLPEETERFLVASCMKLFERLECRDYARFDWRLDENGTPRLLEVNPNPGWCWDGHMAKMSKLIGISYEGMLEKILMAAEERRKKSTGNSSVEINQLRDIPA